MRNSPAITVFLATAILVRRDLLVCTLGLGASSLPLRLSVDPILLSPLAGLFEDNVTATIHAALHQAQLAYDAVSSTQACSDNEMQALQNMLSFGVLLCWCAPGDSVEALLGALNGPCWTQATHHGASEIVWRTRRTLLSIVDRSEKDMDDTHGKPLASAIWRSDILALIQRIAEAAAAVLGCGDPLAERLVTFIQREYISFGIALLSERRAVFDAISSSMLTERAIHFMDELVCAVIELISTEPIQIFIKNAFYDIASTIVTIGLRLISDKFVPLPLLSERNPFEMKYICRAFLDEMRLLLQFNVGNRLFPCHFSLLDIPAANFLQLSEVLRPNVRHIFATLFLGTSKGEHDASTLSESFSRLENCNCCTFALISVFEAIKQFNFVLEWIEREPQIGPDACPANQPATSASALHSLENLPLHAIFKDDISSFLDDIKRIAEKYSLENAKNIPVEQRYISVALTELVLRNLSLTVAAIMQRNTLSRLKQVICTARHECACLPDRVASMNFSDQSDNAYCLFHWNDLFLLCSFIEQLVNQTHARSFLEEHYVRNVDVNQVSKYIAVLEEIAGNASDNESASCQELDHIEGADSMETHSNSADCNQSIGENRALALKKGTYFSNRDDSTLIIDYFNPQSHAELENESVHQHKYAPDIASCAENTNLES